MNVGHLRNLVWQREVRHHFDASTTQGRRERLVEADDAWRGAQEFDAHLSRLESVGIGRHFIATWRTRWRPREG